MKTLKLSHFEFFRCLSDALKTIESIDLKCICPGDPIPRNAVVAGMLPHHLQLFLALLTMMDTRLQQKEAAFEAATASGKYDEGPAHSELRSLQENVSMVESLFWHMVRAEVPPPPEFDQTVPDCAYGPNLEVYYTAVEVVGKELPQSPLSFEVTMETQVIQ